MAETRQGTVAVVQAAPVFLDREATLEKACRLIAEAAGQGAQLIVFPEGFVPAYPDWVWLVPPGEQGMLDELYAELVANSVSIPDSATQRLCAAAAKAKAYVAIGLSERNRGASNASLYNSLLYINPNGEIMGVHRKLLPTSGERMVWAQGDGSTLATYETPLGIISGLICWENYMPLARSALYAWGTQIYLAPTWDRGDLWLATMRHIAKEGGLYVASCCMTLHLDDIPDRLPFKQLYAPGTEWINRGQSCIVNPRGELIAGPVAGREEILYAEVHLSQVHAAKRMFDVAGHYARPDVFRLEVNRNTYPI